MWPQCKAGKHLVPIVCGKLVKAIKRESNQAVAHHWGISQQTVTSNAAGARREEDKGNRQQK